MIVPKVDLPGSRKLSPMEMNKIVFETGKHSEKKAAATASSSTTLHPKNM